LCTPAAVRFTSEKSPPPRPPPQTPPEIPFYLPQRSPFISRVELPPPPFLFGISTRRSPSFFLRGPFSWFPDIVPPLSPPDKINSFIEKKEPLPLYKTCPPFFSFPSLLRNESPLPCRVSSALSYKVRATLTSARAVLASFCFCLLSLLSARSVHQITPRTLFESFSFIRPPCFPSSSHLLILFPFFR